MSGEAELGLALASPLAGVVARYRDQQGEELRDQYAREQDRRKPGRPLKRTESYLRELLKAHSEVVAWFVAERGCQPSSDVELYTAFFGWQFESSGQRAGRASSTTFRGALKTLRNELAEARRLERTNPGNAGVFGMRWPVK